MKQWYQELFDNYSNKYDNESFTQGTLGECDFIEREAAFNKGINILDIGCGTGRHAIELTKRGYNVTGIDLSESQLKRAGEKAAEQNLNINFLKCDARELPFKNEFDLAIMLCEGAFPLMETDEMNFSILRNAADALKSKGKLIFTTLNGLFPLFQSVKDYLESEAKEEGAKSSGITFDLMTFRNNSNLFFEDDSGTTKMLQCSERYYVPSEITWMLKSLGFGQVNIYGAKLGAFRREDLLTTEDFEMLVIAERE